MPLTVTCLTTAGAAGAAPGINVWLVGDDAGLLVIDAGGDPPAVAAAVDHRRVHAIVCTHGHRDHVAAAPELSGLVTAPVYLAAADRPLWDAVHPRSAPYDTLLAGDRFAIGGQELQVLPTPGHSPGGTCLYAPAAGLLFGGDTLLAPGAGPGCPGARREAWLAPVRRALAGLPGSTVVHPAHGADTTLEAALGLA